MAAAAADARTAMPGSIAVGDLELRRLAEADLDDLTQAVAASVDRLRPLAGWPNGIPTVEEHRHLLRCAVAEFEAGIGFAYGLREKPTDQLVGMAGFCLLDTDVAEIGVWVRSDRGGRGYGTLAVQALVDVALDHLPGLSQIRVSLDTDDSSVATALVGGHAVQRTVTSNEPASTRSTWTITRAGTQD